MSTYNKTPFFSIAGKAFTGWDSIIEELNLKINNSNANRRILVVECYQGVNHDELISSFSRLNASVFINSEEAFYSEEKISELTYPDVTDDAIFGFITRLNYIDFLNSEKVEKLRAKIKNAAGLVVVYGHAASLIAEDYDCLVYADMARWEIQLRQRSHEINNIGLKNTVEEPGIQYKRSFFVDWRVCDRLKQQLFEKADYWLDTNKKNEPKMVAAQTLLDGLTAVSKSPFRVVPYFDPGPWGGQWMKEVIGLDKSKSNYAWSFDGVPEENSLLLELDGEIIEIPSINLVFYKSTELLGAPVESRFGKEFPIRFDFLDTMDGGNLSLQVHPTTQYIREKFGMNYTQDESYYMLDAKPDATVFLGLKTGCNSEEMLSGLKKSQETGSSFDAEKYVNVFPAKKHDHFLIPNGTIHCSGTNGMVLEISATPYIFTFKLYDWGRMGLNGKPRAINIAHGEQVINWSTDTEYCIENLVDQVKQVGEGDGWREERTGLHKTQFIETRRHWFTKKVLHQTGDSVNVLNLVEGEEAIVESPANIFKPFVVHYAETFIVPAAVGEYSIRPFGASKGKECATIKAYVRHKA
ncbi:class I mannose-6-phosphate isomerase [Flavobacterium aquicola]|uniref:Mannose-6-phosphate isomerase class I n=1 Tax=Flavobacterium aquicola TaxID=1682742 RepID=A0A3E0E963_9FLAO|nr:class I mannose-6-phosphate isomerase [Flavobacterium aquicola]REG94785.1 mannose-6-phosphate isomerase class I [Flavobacterium aquicola]